MDTKTRELLGRLRSAIRSCARSGGGLTTTDVNGLCSQIDAALANNETPLVETRADSSATAASTRLEAVQRADRGELLPCPFCGDNNERDADRLVVDKTLRDGCLASQIEAFAYSVRCGSCAAVGPWTKSESSARVQWNIRTREVNVTTRDVAMTTDATPHDPTQAASDEELGRVAVEATNAYMRVSNPRESPQTWESLNADMRGGFITIAHAVRTAVLAKFAPVLQAARRLANIDWYAFRNDGDDRYLHVVNEFVAAVDAATVAGEMPK